MSKFYDIIEISYKGNIVATFSNSLVSLSKLPRLLFRFANDIYFPFVVFVVFVLSVLTTLLFIQVISCYEGFIGLPPSFREESNVYERLVPTYN